MAPQRRSADKQHRLDQFVPIISPGLVQGQPDVCATAAWLERVEQCVCRIKGVQRASFEPGHALEVYCAVIRAIVVRIMVPDTPETLSENLLCGITRLYHTLYYLVHHAYGGVLLTRVDSTLKKAQTGLLRRNHVRDLAILLIQLSLTKSVDWEGIKVPFIAEMQARNVR
jgi:hypothetical protein